MMLDPTSILIPDISLYQLYNQVEMITVHISFKTT